MLLMLIEIVFAAVMASAGVVLGFWLRSRHPSQVKMPSADNEYTRQALASLHLLAKRVATHVGEHSSRVEKINAELSSSDADEPEAVIDAVTKLIEANGTMQRQLGDAETRLQKQARLIKSHAVQARTDALTGLANRRAFDDEIARRLSEYQQSKTPFAMAMLDVDKFKKFNDTYGHQAGDEVLRGIADVMREASRGTDLVARYGGEEIAVILDAVSLDDAAASGERFRRAIEQTPFHYGDTEMRVTVSIGVAQILDEDSASLISRADEALYVSKDGGRNCVHWHDGQTAHRFGQTAPEEPAATPADEVEPDSDAPSAPDTIDNLAQLCDVLSSRLAEFKRGGTSPSLLLVQLDDDAGIRAARGRKVAGLAFQAVQKLLKAAVRDMDTVTLYKETTLAAMLPDAGFAGAIRVADRLRSAVAKCSIFLPTGAFRFTVSTSAVEATEEDTLQTMQSRAEEALAKAVAAGGNRSYLHNGERCASVASMLQETS